MVQGIVCMAMGFVCAFVSEFAFLFIIFSIRIQDQNIPFGLDLVSRSLS